MKIVHISSAATGGGAAIAALRLHQSMMNRTDIDSHLVQRFHIDEGFANENNILTAPTNRAFFARLRKKYNYHTEHFHWVKLNKYPRNYEIATFATTSYRLEELPIVKDADIIHLHWVAEFLNYPTFFKNIKQPIVWTLHDINPFRGMFHFDSDREKNMDNFGIYDKQVMETKIKSINKKDNISVVCLSSWMKNMSQQSKALGRYPHYIIPNGLDLDKYPKLDRAEAKRQIGVDNGLKTILVVGASLENEQKGFPMLFDAVNRQENNNFNFISIGNLSDKNVIKKEINHIHINKIDSVSELNKYYSAADITVIPSKEDNLPNTMLESFANGTPVVSFSNGGMTDHITTGSNGVLIKEIGTEPLQETITDFLNNKYIFDSETIRHYAENNFSDKLQTERYIKLYNDLLNK